MARKTHPTTFLAVPSDYINIVQIFPDRIDFSVAEISRQAKALGIKKFATSLSFHPQTTPARDLIAPLCEVFEKIKAGVKKEKLDIELGVLIQSHSGHGWNGKIPLTEERWQTIVLSDGKSTSRFCALDKDFQGYVEEVVDSIVAKEPDFLLIDDDFGPRDWECYCPLHIELYNKALGTSYTGDEIRSIVRTRPWNDAEVAKISKARAESVLPLAKLIRKTINRRNPELRCGICVGVNYGFGHIIAKALAGPKTKPFIRIGNGIYGCKPPTAFYGVTRKTYRMLNILSPSITDILNEADTFPQNAWGTNAQMFGAQTALGLWAGIGGAKMWMAEFESPIDRKSQSQFESTLLKRSGMHHELLSIAQSIKRTGIAAPLYPIGALAYNSEKAGGWLYCADWLDALLGPLGLPILWSKPSKEKQLYALCGCDVELMSDSDIKRVLSHPVLIDSGAAKILTARGFSSLMGVKADNGDSDFFFTREDFVSDNNLRMNLMWEESMAHLTPTSKSTKIITEFKYFRGAVDTAPKTISPGMTFYKNRLGGRVCVVGWSPMEPYYKKFRLTRRSFIFEAIKWLTGALPDGTFAEYGNVLIQTGELPNKAKVLFGLNLTSDTYSNFSVHIAKRPRKAELLLPNGRWEALKYTVSKAQPGVISFKHAFKPLEPTIIRWTE